MKCSRIEIVVKSMAVGLIVLSVVYHNWIDVYKFLLYLCATAKAFEISIMTFRTTIVLIGSSGTIVTLFMLLYSLHKQSKQHEQQISKASANHDIQLKQMRNQFSTKMTRIIMNDRQNNLTKYIISAANNIHYYKCLGVSKGLYSFLYSNEEQDNFCVLLWKMKYKDEKKLDENYTFELYFKVYSIKETFGFHYNSKNTASILLSCFIESEFLNWRNCQPYWDFKISIPRFKNGYGELASSSSTKCKGRIDIKTMDFYRFACIAEAMGEIQMWDGLRIIKARVAANSYPKVC